MFMVFMVVLMIIMFVLGLVICFVVWYLVLVISVVLCVGFGSERFWYFGFWGDIEILVCGDVV